MTLFDVNDFEILSSAPEGGDPILWVNASFEGISEDYPVDCTTSFCLTPEDQERLGDAPISMNTMIDFIDDVHDQIDWEPVTD